MILDFFVNKPHLYECVIAVFVGIVLYAVELSAFRFQVTVFGEVCLP